MSLSPEEREFVIRGSDDSDEIMIYCASSVFATKLRKAGIIPDPETVSEDGSFDVVVSKKHLSLRSLTESKPRKPMSEEHKKKLADGREKKKKEKEGNI